MRAEIKKLHTRLQTTMVYVTHDQVEAMTLGDRIVVLKDGEIQQADRPLAVYERPTNLFVAGFVGTPPMNFLKGGFEAAADAFVFTEGESRLRLPEALSPALRNRTRRDMILGVRPEDLRPVAAGEKAETPPGSTVKGTITVLEPLGDEMLVYIGVRQHELIAKASPQFQGRVNDPVDVVLNVNRLHPFDAETGARIEAN